MKNWARENKGFLVFLALFGIFRTAIADWNPIPSASMHPNLLEGDVVFVNRVAYDLKVPLTDISLARLGEPQRGDVVTFSSPKDGTRLIKRIAALPGDTVEMRGERLIVNGKQAEYTVLGNHSEDMGVAGQLQALQLSEANGDASYRIQILPQVHARRDFAPLVIPANQFLMLGDNRDNSSDSRYIGLVPRDLLIGRAERILVSANITDRWQPRFERIGASLRPQ
ncbi:signal peptidase I [Massilia sp. MB5]|uniref:signal peptidase I n=1 Tax=unclassified Massilia TaxID=2609279 RepID=UPI00067CEED1|nr:MULTISPECIES: signal peptidase I [unclassified Massilia]AKU22441.1 signal peptidase [Massilia sp. NR 4-1]UMR32776.1 signal peptidase I [Massilia sp. MB5]